MTAVPRTSFRAALAICLLAVAASVFPSASLQPQQAASELMARVEGVRTPGDTGVAGLTLQQVMARFNVPGVSVAVIRDFEIHWAKGYGLADVRTGRAVDTSTRFQAASISKPLTAMAALRLAQEGRLSIDEDVNKLLESWEVPVSEHNRSISVTPRSLFSHSSGAHDDGFGFPGYDPAVPRPTVVQILNGETPSNVGRMLFARPPFQAYKYSGGGVTVMQLALTELVDRPFAELMQTYVLGPLRMTNSSYQQPMAPADEPRAAHMHDGMGAAMSAPWHIYPEQAAAGLWTTASDLARFVIEVQKAVRGPSGSVLDQARAKEMVTPVGIGPYSVGLSIAKRGEGWYFSHTGSNRGFRALIVGHLRNGYGLVVMTNGDRGGSVYNEIEARVIAAYAWDVLARPLPR